MLGFGYKWPIKILNLVNKNSLHESKITIICLLFIEKKSPPSMVAFVDKQWLEKVVCLHFLQCPHFVQRTTVERPLAPLNTFTNFETLPGLI